MYNMIIGHESADSGSRGSVSQVGRAVMVERIFFDAEALNRVPYGACVTDSENRIVFWNRGAEALVGHSREEAVGKRCYDVIGCRAVGGSPLCAEGKGCPAADSSQDEDAAAPGFFDANLICASGRGRSVTFVPLPQCPAAFGEGAALKLFSERAAQEEEYAAASAARETAERRASLTPRETEVVNLLAQGFGTSEIASELTVSVHTVLNHIRNARGKMDAKDRVALVVRAAGG